MLFRSGTYEQSRGHTIAASFAGTTCRVLDLNTLIAAKRFAGREKDKPAIRELEAIRELLRKNAAGDAGGET